jgi:hypothetical protein
VAQVVIENPILNSLQQQPTLATLRNTLLPKLISGVVRVNSSFIQEDYTG